MSSGKDALIARGKMSAAGIVDDPSTQTRVIPESRRADGSIRKERKVKPGFTPAEDVGRFRPSRVLRAQEEAAAKQTRGSIPGSESYSLSSSSPSSSQPSAVGAASKALAKSSVAETPASSSPLLAATSQSSSEQLGLPLPAARSDGPWRRTPPATAKEERSSNGKSHAETSWRHQPKLAVTSTTSSSRTDRESSWRRPLKKDDNKERQASIPDSWDTEDGSSNDAQVDQERPGDTATPLTHRKDEDDSIRKLAEELNSLKVGNSK